MIEKGRWSDRQREPVVVILWVGAGGVVGAVLRYLVVMGVNGAVGGSGVPYGTLVVNAVGCFLVGLIVGFVESHKPLSPEMQGFLVIGVLGGFTTFSAFGMETIRLFRDQAYVAGSANVLLQLGVGLGTVVVGLRVGQLLKGVG